MKILAQKLDKYLLVPFFLFAFFLPFHLPASNIFLALSIIIIFYKVDTDFFFNTNFFLTSTSILFVAYLIGVIYSENVNKGLIFLGRISTFLIIPLALGFRSKLNIKKIQNTLLLGLTIGLILTCLYLLLNVLFNYTKSGDFTLRALFSYRYTTQKFVLPLHDSHPTYLGFYILTNSAMLEFSNFKLKKRLKTVFYIVTIISLIFLNSRVIFISGLIYFIFYFFIKLKNKRQKIVFFVSLVTAVIGTIYLLKDTYFVKKWERGVVWDLSKNIGNSNTTKKLISDSRMARWQVALSEILKEPIFGHGTGSEILTLKRGYLENNLIFSYEKKYNAHNQYLNYLIELGIFGLSVFMFFLIFNCYEAIKPSCYKQLLLIIFIICISMTENLLVRNMGITFFAMFFNINKAVIYNEKRPYISKT
ncbi:O-antigen ligase family protein [Gaetbulibacter sp. PBL-D1]|uniref:O-antigen ligase family protein n=1 Tax=Gaetbulibacter sp. PBL-D1 TaxID=3422594 RepID=UPI003D2F1B94